MTEEKWNRVRRERDLRGLSEEDAAREIGISVEALSQSEQDQPLEPADQLRVGRWLDDIGRARIARVEKLEELAEELAEVACVLTVLLVQVGTAINKERETAVWLEQQSLDNIVVDPLFCVDIFQM